jgi:hypothetical protein
MYEIEEPIFKDNAFNNEDLDNIGDYRKFIYYRERVILLIVLSNTTI